jgi:AAA+ ATPase superfamily predicted ATPase
MRNPFLVREIQAEEPFCDRNIELKELVSHGESFANVVLYSHRRYGKTSLVKRVQKALQSRGIITVYTDFFGLVTIDEIAERLVKCVYAYAYKDETLFRKAIRAIKNWRPVIKPDAEAGLEVTVEQTTNKNGFELLEETFSLFGSFVKEHSKGFNIVLDEFQEITNLTGAIKIEGVLRSQMQTQANVGYFFVGSRRRMLLDIFNEQKRPFYKSAINYALGPLPRVEAVAFIVERFRDGGKNCPASIAEAVYDKTGGYPFYIQRIPYEIFALSDEKRITMKDYESAITSIVKTDAPNYEYILSGLSTVQKQLLYAIAKEPITTPLNPKYMLRHRLSSAGSTQPALQRLVSFDMIEKQDDDGRYHVIDPFLAMYLVKGR